MTEVPTDPREREIYDLATRIGLAWRELRRGASAAALRDYLYGQGKESIEMGQMDTLDLLVDGRPWRMTELAEALRVEPSTATRAVQRLVNAGLAARRTDSGDGRVVKVAITNEGITAHRAVAERRVEMMSFIVSRFRRQELRDLAEMLERFIGSVDTFFVDHPATE
ncbi:MAG: MarR family transcriptional regulator [Actinomycetota bacterium]